MPSEGYIALEPEFIANSLFFGASAYLAFRRSQAFVEKSTLTGKVVKNQILFSPSKFNSFQERGMPFRVAWFWFGKDCQCRWIWIHTRKWCLLLQTSLQDRSRKFEWLLSFWWEGSRSKSRWQRETSLALGGLAPTEKAAWSFPSGPLSEESSEKEELAAFSVILVLLKRPGRARGWRTSSTQKKKRYTAGVDNSNAGSAFKNCKALTSAASPILIFSIWTISFCSQPPLLLLLHHQGVFVLLDKHIQADKHPSWLRFSPIPSSKSCGKE
jgi:hypothetical protein